jgi:glycosyltransferase involved in cell wall biosynthesis
MQGEGGLREKGVFKASMDGRPLISVITVVFNDGEYLEKTICSIINQKYDNVEYIVIDGGSTDNTIDIIRKYENSIDYWISESDAGIYEAMNKGLSIAGGDWINFMNSGDFFLNEYSLVKVYKEIDLHADAMQLFFSIQYTTGEIVKPVYGKKILLHNTIPHQGAFYKKCLFDSFSYNEDLKLISDYELNLLNYTRGISGNVTSDVIAICMEGGVSRVNEEKFIEETNYVRSNVLTSPYNLLLSIFFRLKVFLDGFVKY